MPRRNSGAKLRWLDKRGCYYIVWTENGRSRQRSTGSTDRGAAQAALAEFIFRQGRAGDTRNPNEILVTEALAFYALAHEETTAAVRIGYAISALTPFWKGCSIADIQDETCKRYARLRARSAGTVRRELTVLRSAVNYLMDKNRLTRAPKVWLPDNPPARDIWLTRSEFARLLKAARSMPKARSYLPLYMLIAIYTGRRKEAVTSLRWHQVNLETGIIDFLRRGQSETTKRRGKCRIAPQLLGHLRRAKDKSGAAEFAFVVNADGKQVADIKKSFANAVQAAGLGKHVTPHTLKHTTATWMLQAHVSIWDASDFLATSVETLQKVYGHHAPEHQERALKGFKKASA